VDAGKLTLTVVTPERALVSQAACDEVTLPAEAGQIGILPGHTPLITLLGIGVVTFRNGGEKTSVAVRGGFAEISSDNVRILADRAVSKATVDAAAAGKELGEAETRRQAVVGDEELDAVNADAAFAQARLDIAN
jgi:F-type H+-transporting ATPase subunit epsilon